MKLGYNIFISSFRSFLRCPFYFLLGRISFYNFISKYFVAKSLPPPEGAQYFLSSPNTNRSLIETLRKFSFFEDIGIMSEPSALYSW